MCHLTSVSSQRPAHKSHTSVSEGKGTAQAIPGSFTEYSQIPSPLPCCHLSHLTHQRAKCGSAFAQDFASCSLTVRGLVGSLPLAGHGYLIARSPIDHVRLPESGAQCSRQWMSGFSLNVVSDSLGGSIKPSTRPLRALCMPYPLSVRVPYEDALSLRESLL